MRVLLVSKGFDKLLQEQRHAVIYRCQGLSVCSAVYKDVRRIVAKRFPFSVYFRAEVRRVVVLAVFHGSPDPAIWQRRR